jgi:hypothetical protein
MGGVKQTIYNQACCHTLDLCWHGYINLLFNHPKYVPFGLRGQKNTICGNI